MNNSVANKIGLNFREYWRGSIATEQGEGLGRGTPPHRVRNFLENMYEMVAPKAT